MSKWEFDEANKISKDVIILLEKALKTGDPSSKISRKICKLHETWIKMYWPTYSKDAHLALVKMYTEDERFKAYYENVGEGATEFLFRAMVIYLNQ